jgi:hypothetical protein
MIRQPGQHIGKPGPRIDVVELAGIVAIELLLRALTPGLLLSAICEPVHTSLAVPDYNPKGIAS